MIDIVFLGTGSAMPAPQRNLSGVALLRQGEIFLFDCGEGTQMQFRRAGLRPGRLRHIFISHFHGDHLFGLPGLLTSLQMAGLHKEVHLFGPRGLDQYIHFHRSLCSFTLEFPLHVHEIEEWTEKVLWKTPEYQIEWQPLQHRIFTAGFTLIEALRPGKFDVERAHQIGVPDGPERGKLQNGEHVKLADGRIVHPHQVLGPPRPGVKIAYTLDTSPCIGQDKLAHNADALIADATFPSAEKEWALQTGHSTAADAAQAAKKCNVQKLFLTHFSGTLNEADLVAHGEEARTIFPNSIIATDLSRFTIQAISA
ncbi:MAG: ribonuclease Z [bacterium]